MGSTPNDAGSAQQLSPADELLRWAANQPHRLVGDSPQRLAELVDQAILYNLASGDGGFAADIGVYKNPDAQTAIKNMREKLPGLIKKAGEIVEMANSADRVPGWRGNVDALRFLLHAAFDPQGERGDEMMEFTERVASALATIAALPLPLPLGRRGGVQRQDAAAALVKAVCVYRQEFGLDLSFDFKISQGSAEAFRQVDTDTAALIVKVADLWGMSTSPAELRTMLRNFGQEVKQRAVPPKVDDLLWWSDSTAGPDNR